MCALKNHIGISYIEFWYSLEHVVFPMKICFAPGEFDFQQNQFDLYNVATLKSKQNNDESNV